MRKGPLTLMSQAPVHNPITDDLHLYATYMVGVRCCGIIPYHFSTK